MKTKFFVGIATIALSVATISCSKAPQAEIDAATIAVDSAKIAGAEYYVPEAFNALQDSLKSAMETVEVQKSKMFGKFAEAKEKLVNVTVLAKDVTIQTETVKAEMKIQVDTLLLQVDSLVIVNKQLLTKAPKGKEGAQALKDIEADNNQIEASVADAKAIYNTGNYISALEKVKAAQEKAVAINNELSAAISKTKGRK